jgi:type I restriction enzyme M protein
LKIRKIDTGGFMPKKKAGNNNTNDKATANLGFEQKLWLAADKLRGNMDAAEYKHVILGLIFLKYISDSFENRREWLVKETTDPKSTYHVKDDKHRQTVLEDRDEYISENVFWVPPSARWKVLKDNAKQPTIGKIIDEAMETIEKENPRLKGILPRNYGRPDLDKTRLGELIDLISTISVGYTQNVAQDVLGRVYEYFLGRFASAEGKSGGEFYTPSCVVRVLVEMIEPYKGRIYDPCEGSGGMFVQSEKFVESHGGRRGDISIYGQESNPTTWRLAAMNLAIRGIEANLGGQWADTFHNDLHPDLKADYIMANPPFNISDWGGDRLREDKRWVYGVPPLTNANFAWVEHMIYHLAPAGIAGFVLANGSMSSNMGGEGEIRKAIIEADLVDCMIAMPGQLFYSTQIPVCLWFLTRSKANKGFRNRQGQTLFIDVRKMGTMIDRVHRELTDEDIMKIATTYHAWRGEPPSLGKLRRSGKELAEYSDVPGFCKSAKLDEIRKHGHVLTPGRYVGTEDVEDDGEPFDDKMKRLVTQLREQTVKARKLDEAIVRNMKELGYDI